MRSNGNDIDNKTRPAFAARLARWSALAARLRGSLARRGLRGTLRRIAGGLRSAQARASVSLSLERLDAPFEPFALPASAAPAASIVIPMHGKPAYTLACLRSIARYGALAPFEVIVVDDASPPADVVDLTKIEGLRLLRNEDNLGFIGSCNAGAAIARGEYLCFLNNDTQVTPGWLDALLDCLRTEADAGLAGARLVYPDGRLQEAGGIVFADGSCWNYGRFDDPDDPRYGFRREADYCSGAAMLIGRALFQRLGALDTRYAPGYYEDADLAFAVRAAGLRVLYEPAAQVVHHEGVTGGTDEMAGVKRYQVRNRDIFRVKWRDALSAQPTPRTPVESAAVHRARGRILIVDAELPDITRDSGSLRAVNLMRVLRGLGWHVVFIPDDGRDDPVLSTPLRELGVEVQTRPWTRNAAAWLRAHGRDLDAVIAARHYVASGILPLARTHAPRAGFVFDTVDLHYLREMRAADLAADGAAALHRHASRTRKRELALIAASDITLVVSPRECELLAQELPRARIEVLSNIHDVHARGAEFGARQDLVFIGGFQHPPNLDAVRWFAQGMLPQLRARQPGIVLHVLGDTLDHAAEFDAVEGLRLHGRVGDLGPFLDTCRVSVAPLRYGAGVKGKINMAMSHGLPVVATPVAVEGMGLTDGIDVVLADDTPAFVEAVVRLYRDAELWRQLSDAGIENVREYFGFDVARATLERLLGNAQPATPTRV